MLCRCMPSEASETSARFDNGGRSWREAVADRAALRSEPIEVCCARDALRRVHANCSFFSTHPDFASLHTRSGLISTVFSAARSQECTVILHQPRRGV